MQAIGEVENHIQVIARAGSGKTSTLVNRVLFLQKHCRIDSSEILILAFNRRAAEEIQERLARSLQNSLPHVMTFHALAYALVHPDQEIVFDQSGGEQSQSKALQFVIDDYLNDNSEYYSRIRNLMMAKFRKDWEKLERKGYLLSQEEMLAYRRSLPREGLDGRYYKSFGEKVIANFLFEHDLDYKYERNYNWDGINYRPDFTIFTGNDQQQGIILEYFGLEGDPDFDEMSERKRQFWRRDDKRKQWKFLEFNPQQISSGELEFSDLIKTSLENLAVECHKLSENEIWEKAKRRAIDNFTKAMTQFIQLCRKQFLSPEELQDKIQEHESIDEFESEFLELGRVFYEAYLARLEVMGEEEFDGLMQASIGLVESGNTIFSRKSGSGDLNRLKYILIDEYQDFSKLFYRLIEAIRRYNQQALFFCVGDDWQSINGFAGSDLQYYQNFQEYFPNSLRLNISTNYRSASSIVTNGNLLMQGLGEPARPYKQESGIVKLVDLQSFKPTQKEIEDHKGDCITPVILRLLNKVIIEDNQEVVLLNRKNTVSWYVNGGNSLDNFLKNIRRYLSQDLRERVTIATPHKYKGLEKQVVIILDAVANSYPLIHPNWVFTRIFGQHSDEIIAEERRLFYVAMTRAVENLYIITERDRISPFLHNLRIEKLVWNDYPPLVDIERYITIEIGNQLGRNSQPTCTISHLLKSERYQWNSNRRVWYRNIPINNFSIKDILHQSWRYQADGIEICLYNDSRKQLGIFHVNNGEVICIDDDSMPF